MITSEQVARKKELLKNRGFIIHEGRVNNEPFIVVATLHTSNRKTGNMVQIWFLLTHHNPIDAVNLGIDAKTICKGCRFASGNGCYVNLSQAPLAIWKSHNRKNYPKLDPKDYALVLGGRKIRFGAYGNPSLLPISIVKSLAAISNGWTGYFHDWKEMDPITRKEYGKYFMASTENAETYECASNMGLRSFHVSTVKPEGAIECLSESKGMSCEQCKLCAGNAKTGKPNVWIQPHGRGRNRVIAIAGE